MDSLNHCFVICSHNMTLQSSTFREVDIFVIVHTYSARYIYFVSGAYTLCVLCILCLCCRYVACASVCVLFACDLHCSQLHTSVEETETSQGTGVLHYLLYLSTDTFHK